MFEMSIIEKLMKGARKVKFALLGPAFIAAIGYIDPGNFVTNIQAGTSYGYKLLWVIVWANIMAMIIQLMSAKLGIVTGKNLAEHIRDRFPRPVVWFYWIQAEIIAIATDLAEFLGASLGFKLLLDISLFNGAILTGVATFLILLLQNYGQRSIEIIVGSLLIFVAGAYAIELFFSKPQVNELISGLAIPMLPNLETVFLSAAILGATIMPHVIYLHSALTQFNDGNNNMHERYATAKVDVVVAMTIAGFVNLSMMATAAAVFHFGGYSGISQLDQAYLTLKPILGQAAATIFSLSLVAAGLSSTVVGTMAGQVVMQGFVHFSIPLWVRRFVTMLPSFIVIWIGCDIAHILVLSQVVLSFGIALALVPLITFTGNNEIMGNEMVNSSLLQNVAKFITLIVFLLNVYLIIEEIRVGIASL
ncbi:divalent metal cation transporter [Candidatus Pantoea edessiphila]|uniref:Divalent metal cation transporter MntH n=1 Tax=Candidatus Pantoea edessiphila TaxID=2044610 RepID=A0A2P5SYL0_9GAMM|nr:Nramp family divalent metal transporter [Candidatus Pantoea edessiphila]MBK4775491.1 divalent metal cation transporter [Pantoea sp. Edef]PPI87380.1 divalent metal cation transporter [Candidatus Pantoea edessiphila]